MRDFDKIFEVMATHGGVEAAPRGAGVVGEEQPQVGPDGDGVQAVF
ncbi:hypothetical protein [Frankia sp. Cr1]|nr:hypothetical protein [Frankia sp. Cr1]